MNIELIEGLLAIILSIIGFYVRRGYNRMDALEKELTDHRLLDVEKYVPRSEMQDFADRIRTDIQGIVTNIDNKLQNIESHLRSGRSGDH